MNSAFSNRPKHLHACFRSEEILLEGGRNLYALLRAFLDQGYRITLDPELPGDPGRYGRLALELEGVTLADRPPSTATAPWLLHDGTRPPRHHDWARRIRVAWDIFAPYRSRVPVLFPYPMHPLNNRPEVTARLPELRALPKTMGLFFAGDSEGYDRNRVRYPAPKLPRRRVLDALEQGLGERLVKITEPHPQGPGLLPGLEERFVLVDHARAPVAADAWLPTVARAHFFLAPPGIVMPMCHNIVEAMAVGTIPLTSYPEWFVPDLEPERNCLAYEDEEDLLRQVHRALAMDPATRARLRQGALDYYQRHLLPARAVTALEQRPERNLILLMIGERNMARQARRLGPDSLIIRGPRRRPAWWQRMLGNG